MRTILCSTMALLLLAMGTAAQGQNAMPWHNNLEAAQQLAAKTNRLVLIHFWAPWCRPCMRLEQEVFNKPETAKGLEANFVLVKLNADEAPGTARLYGVSSLPSDVITTSNGRLVSQIQSPPTAVQYVQQMNQAAAGHYALARKVSDANAPGPAAVPDPAATPGAPVPPVAAPATPYEQPVAPPVANVAQATGMPAPDMPSPGAAAPNNERFAEYYPENQPAAATSAVTPAQAYGVPNEASSAAHAPVDPYAQPAAAPAAGGVDPYAPPANPYAAPANPYAAPANPYAAPVGAPEAAAPVNPYAAPPAAAPSAPPAGNPYEAPANPYAPSANPYAAPQADPYASQPAMNPTAPANPYAAPQQPVGQAPGMQPPVMQASVAPQVQAPQLPPGCPPLALDGNCPVTLVERKRWAVGHPTFGAVHRGRTYLFLGPTEREKFLADPDRFSPVLAGLDPVQAIDRQAQVPGKREFGVFGADGRIYLFADGESRDRFEKNEQHYTAAVSQAMQQPTYQAMRPTP